MAPSTYTVVFHVKRQTTSNNLARRAVSLRQLNFLLLRCTKSAKFCVELPSRGQKERLQQLTTKLDLSCTLERLAMMKLNSQLQVSKWVHLRAPVQRHRSQSTQVHAFCSRTYVLLRTTKLQWYVTLWSLRTTSSRWTGAAIRAGGTLRPCRSSLSLRTCYTHSHRPALHTVQTQSCLLSKSCIISGSVATRSIIILSIFLLHFAWGVAEAKCI